MKFKSKSIVIEANQFNHSADSPIGVRVRYDGSCYVISRNGIVNVKPGDWIILEDPPGDGTLAYPCSPDVFEKRWELLKTEDELKGELTYCFACGFPNKPDGCCSRSDCCNSD